MAKLFKCLVILFWASLSMIFSLILFINGFFLHRNARIEQNNCSSSEENIFHFRNSLSIASECLKPRARVILLVVDALKYEFTTTFYDTKSAATFHRNKLPIINEILKKFSSHSKLLKFIADPPTTTMQRLKSMTTGTLPTFIDIHNNFAVDSIIEDNFITQNMDNGNIFMGDDTWIKLYPNKFLRQYAFPSFDVSDLDTVDLEVKNQIFKEIKNTDWSLLIAHILGIDHCGHKHGMHHPEMLRKLNETNFFIQEIIEQINKENNDTILFVVGDHGMTETGDHGGNQIDEIEAAMFIYSTLPLIQANTTLEIKEKSNINQIDIVPTISVILGIPIPFSNIGKLIIEAIPKKKNVLNLMTLDFNFILHSLWKNVFQVQHYINTYSSENFLANQNKLIELNKMYNELQIKLKFIKSISDLKDYINISEKYFTTVRKICFEVWVQFDSKLMTRGLVLFFCTIFSFFILISELIDKQRMYLILESSFLTRIFTTFILSLLINVWLYWLQVIDDFINTSLFFCGLIPVFYFVNLLIKNCGYISIMWFQKSHIQKPLINIFSRIILLTVVFGVFSNSYIIQENIILSYFLITLFCLFLFSKNTQNKIKSLDKKIKSCGKSKKEIINISLLPLIIFTVCLLIRSSNYFWRKRNEQKQLKNEEKYINFIFGKDGSIVSTNLEIILVLIAIASLSVYILVIQIWLCDCRNLSGYSSSGFLTRVFPAVIVIIIAFYWILKLQRNKLNPIFIQHINTLPIIVYILFGKFILLIFYCPLTIFLLPKVKEKITIYQEESLILKFYKKFKNVLYNKKNNVENQIPMVFILGTVYSACFVLLSVFLCLIYTLLLGFIITPSVIIMNLICIGLLYINAIDRINNATNLEELLHVSNPTILCWFLIAEYFFYATGHQPSFSTIHWDAGFIGIDGSFQINSARAILIGINTFGSHIILGIMLPLLIFAPFTLKLNFHNLTKPRKIEWCNIKQDEFVLFQNDTQFHTAIFNVSGKYILFHAFKVFICMLAATIHCRHLMVWSIFAPKLIFQGLSFIITVVSVLISILLLLRIKNNIDKFIFEIT